MRATPGWHRRITSTRLILSDKRFANEFHLCQKRIFVFGSCSGQSSGLSLITAAIVHWNTVYLDRAVRQLRAQGTMVPDDLLTHVAPLGWEHISLTGDYVWTKANPVVPFRPLREVRSMFQPLAA
jgi:hypothetical protein